MIHCCRNNKTQYIKIQRGWILFIDLALLLASKVSLITQTASTAYYRSMLWSQMEEVCVWFGVCICCVGDMCVHMRVQTVARVLAPWQPATVCLCTEQTG